MLAHFGEESIHEQRLDRSKMTWRRSLEALFDAALPLWLLEIAFKLIRGG